MRKIVIAGLIALLGVVPSSFGQDSVQTKVDGIWESYNALKSFTTRWSNSGNKVSEDSLLYVKINHFNPIVESCEEIKDSCTKDQAIAIQYLKTSAHSNMFGSYQRNGFYQKALETTGDYKSILSYTTDTAGKFHYKGALYNVSQEKIEIAQYYYLSNLYNLANRLNDSLLKVYTSRLMAGNKRASLYNQTVALSYLFKVSFHSVREGEFGNMRYKETSGFAHKLLDNFSNLSITNRKRYLGSDAYFLKQFSTDYYMYSKKLIVNNLEQFDSSLAFGIGRNPDYKELSGFAESLEVLQFIHFEKFDTKKFFDLAERSFSDRSIVLLTDLVMLANGNQSLKLDCDGVKSMMKYCDTLYMQKMKESYKKRSFRICK